MTKLSLIAKPKFDAMVPVPVAGAEPCPVRMTFKHRTRSAMHEFMQTRAGKTDTESFMEMVVGWELEAEFNAENVTILLENYICAGAAAYETYRDEIVKYKLKN